MSVFLDIADHYALVDAAIAGEERQAYQADDDAAFDKAVKARLRNDQAYFLYLFTRFEAEVNQAVETLLLARTDLSIAWADRRVWTAWSRGRARDIAFLSKVEVLTDKGHHDYSTAREYYQGRNTIAHGEDWDAQFFVPNIAQAMHDMVRRFVTS